MSILGTQGTSGLMVCSYREIKVKSLAAVVLVSVADQASTIIIAILTYLCSGYM